MSHWSLKVKQWEQKLNRFHFWDSFTAKKKSGKRFSKYLISNFKGKTISSIELLQRTISTTRTATNENWHRQTTKIGKIECDILFIEAKFEVLLADISSQNKTRPLERLANTAIIAFSPRGNTKKMNFKARQFTPLKYTKRTKFIWGTFLHQTEARFQQMN